MIKLSKKLGFRGVRVNDYVIFSQGGGLNSGYGWLHLQLQGGEG